MKLGFYLFAEYINMFISSVIMSTLFFGGYDMPFVNEANFTPNIAALGRNCGTDGQGGVLFIPVHVGALDDSPFPL